MPQIKLVPMSPVEYEAFLADAVRGYAEDKVLAGEWHPAQAPDMARQALRRMLPEGVATRDQYLLTIRDAASGARVGMVWFGVLEGLQRPYVFVYDFRIDAPFRGKGYGRTALVAIKEKVKALGIDKIEMHALGRERAALHEYDYAASELIHIEQALEQVDHIL